MGAKKNKKCLDCGKLIWSDSKRCKSCANKGSRHSQWAGGKYIEKGYVYVHCPNHPKTNSRGYVYEHTLVMEKHLGRFLKDKEEIHHVNGVGIDNKIENLHLCKNHAEHIKKFHSDLEILQKGRKLSKEQKENITKGLQKWWKRRKNG